MGESRYDLSPRSLGHAIDEQLIRQAAGLGTLAAVGAAAAEGFAGEALAGVGDAQGAVDENFQRHIGGGVILRISARESSRARTARLDAEAPDKLDAAGFGEGHLGGGVDGQGWAEAGGEPGDAQVLDDHGVGAGRGNGGEIIGGGGELIGEDQGVEGDEATGVVAVEIRRGLRGVPRG